MTPRSGDKIAIKIALIEIPLDQNNVPEISSEDIIQRLFDSIEIP